MARKKKFKFEWWQLIIGVVILYFIISGGRKAALYYSFDTESECNAWRDDHLNNQDECWWCGSCKLNTAETQYIVTCDDHALTSEFEKGVGCEPYCEDTDGGNNPDTKGTITYRCESGSEYSKIDYCDSYGNVMEYECANVDLQSCYAPAYASQCKSGTTCVNGWCEDLCGNGVCDSSEDYNSCPEDCVAPYCEDTDSGNDPNTKGTITYRCENGNSYSKIDYCDSNGNVMEYECANVDLQSCTVNAYPQQCSTGYECSSGVCVESCLDTCQSLNYECGTQTICDEQVECGSCTSGRICVDGLCELGEDKEEFYQETADSISVPYNGDGCKNVNNIYDGNWDSYGGSLKTSKLCEVILEYIKPDFSSQPETFWKIKGDNLNKNLIIPVPCWDYYSNKLQFRIISSNGAVGSSDVNLWYCYNGDWELISKAKYGYWVYEEAMNWVVYTTCVVGEEAPDCDGSVDRTEMLDSLVDWLRETTTTEKILLALRNYIQT